MDIRPTAVFGGAVHRRRLATLLWVAWLCWAAGILWLSSLTPRELPQAAFLLSDKAEHLIAYAVGGWLAATAIRAGRRTATVAGWFVPAVILVAAFGVLDEAVQTFTPGRTGGDLYDWIADALGALTGVLISLLMHRRALARRTGPAAGPMTG